jgi:hypothetical protein
MSLFLSRPGEQSPTKTAVWRDFQAWGIIAQVRSNVGNNPLQNCRFA